MQSGRDWDSTMANYEAVIFDMDGTLTVPMLDFAGIRRELGLPSGTDIMVQLEALTEDERRNAWAIIHHHEHEAMKRQTLQPGTQPLLERCRREAIALALLTRNARASVDSLCRRFTLHFDGIATRESPAVKPSADAVHQLLDPLSIAPANALVVGDFLYDLQCGKAAGTATCFFHNAGCPDFSAQADVSVSSMQELEVVIFGRRTNECACNRARQSSG